MNLSTSNLIFRPNIGLGTIRFSDTRRSVKKALGAPKTQEQYDYGGNSHSLIYHYDQLGIIIYFRHQGKKYEGLSIHANDIFFQETWLSTNTKAAIIALLRTYHKQHQMEFKYTMTEDFSVNEQEYFFEKIGLTIWFERGKISDIALGQVNR